MLENLGSANQSLFATVTSKPLCNMHAACQFDSDMLKSVLIII